MSIFTKQREVASYPAYKVFEREATSHGHVEITTNDKLGLRHPRGFFRVYSPGSVASYALRYNECPIEAVADAKAKGHKLHWINQDASVLSSSSLPQEELVEVTIGMMVRFEGLIATIENDHNNNLKFVPVQAAGSAA
jgi:hypothetical protein